MSAISCSECGAPITPIDLQNSNPMCKHCGLILVLPTTSASDGSHSQAAINEVQNLFTLANAAQQSGNHQSAYAYFSKILETATDNCLAWYGLGISAGWQSTLAKPRLEEMLHGINEAMQRTSDRGRLTLGVQAAQDVQNVASAYKTLAHKHLVEFVSLSDVRTEFFFTHIPLVCRVLLLAKEYDSENVSIRNMLLDVLTIYINGATSGETPKANKLRALLEKWRAEVIDELTRLVPNFEAPSFEIPTLEADRPIRPTGVQSPTQGCFIATASMSGDHGRVVSTLRAFRDDVLLRNSVGKAFVALYYSVSPPMASWISTSGIRRLIARITIVYPAFVVAIALLKWNLNYRTFKRSMHTLSRYDSSR